MAKYTLRDEDIEDDNPVSLEDEEINDEEIEDAKKDNFGQLDGDVDQLEAPEKKDKKNPAKEDKKDESSDEFELTDKQADLLMKLLDKAEAILKLVDGDKKDDKKNDKKDDKKSDDKSDDKDALNDEDSLDVEDLDLGDSSIDDEAPLDDDVEEDDTTFVEDSKAKKITDSKKAFGSVEKKAITDSVSDDGIDPVTKAWVERYNKMSHTQD